MNIWSVWVWVCVCKREREGRGEKETYRQTDRFQTCNFTPLLKNASTTKSFWEWSASSCSFREKRNRHEEKWWFKESNSHTTARLTPFSFPRVPSDSKSIHSFNSPETIDATHHVRIQLTRHTICSDHERPAWKTKRTCHQSSRQENMPRCTATFLVHTLYLFCQ